LATLITVAIPGSEPVAIAVDGQRFADPDMVTIDDEIDTAHLHALPGLADCHAHLAMNALADLSGLDDEKIRTNVRVNAWAQVEGGVLLVVDKGSNSDVSLEILDTPPERRPELQMAGRMIASGGGYYQGYGVEVGPDDLAGAVSRAAGPHGWVKIVADWPRRGVGPQANFPVEAMKAAVDAAHAAGCRVAAHTMAPAGVPSVIGAGVDSVEHGLFMSGDDLEAIAGRDGCWVPTVYGVESIIEFLGADSSGGMLLRQGLDNVRELLPEAERLGVTVLAGSDLALPHGGIAAEAVRLAEFGLSVPAAVAAVSTAAYRYLGSGLPKPSSRADVVFFADDPTDRIATLTEPVLVMRMGKIVVDRR
jgi:imidazolonepropionase-like amidohydrolase